MKSIIPAVIIAICIGMYFIYISPTVSEVKALTVKKSNYDEVAMQSKEVAVQRDNATTDYNNISTADVDKLNKIVPDIFNSVLFANDINAMSARNSLVVKDFKVNPQRTESRDTILIVQNPNPYKTTVVTFRLIGQYTQFVQFLKDLESNLRLVDVVSLSIKSVGGAKSTDNNLEYLLEVNTYSLR